MKKFKMDKLTKKQIGHFNRHIVVGDPDKCWPWVGKTHPSGYGCWTLCAGGRRLYFLSHRLALCLARGIPIESLSKDDVVMHSCDNPPCCNPAHLRLGTHSDNVIDKMNKGRHGGILLKAVELPKIVARILDGETQRSLAREFGVSQAAIWNAFRNRASDNSDLGNRCSRKLSLSDIQSIKSLLSLGVRGKDIAKRFGISPATVSHIRTGYHAKKILG